MSLSMMKYICTDGFRLDSCRQSVRFVHINTAYFAGQLPVAALDEPHGEPGVDAHPAAARVRAGGAQEGGAAEAQLI